MKRLLVAAAVVLMACFMAAPAMAITFTFQGEIDGSFDEVDAFNGTYTLTFVADSSNLGSGYLDPDLTIPAQYYADPFVTGTLTLEGTSYAITDPMYVAYTPLDGGSLGAGIWDPAMINDPLESPFTGDILSIFNFGSYDMLSGIGLTWTDAFLIGGAVNLASGQAFFFEAAPEGSRVSYFASVPEPSMLLLFGSGLTGIFLLRRKA